MSDFNLELSPEAAEKLGVNPDYSPKNEGARITYAEDIDTPEEANDDDSAEEQRKETPEGQPKSDETKGDPESKDTNETGDEQEKPLTFQEQVSELLSVFDTPEKQEQLLKDLPNHEKFMASNTQKSMKLSDREREITAFAERMGHEDVKAAREKLLSDPKELEEFLTATDEWFTSKDENPIRKLVETVLDKSDEHDAFTKEQAEKAEQDKQMSDRELELKLREELIDLYALDPQYKKDEKAVDALADFADKQSVSLVQAHLLQQGMEMGSVVQEKDQTIGDLEKKVANLEKELKAKNKTIDKQNEILGGPGVTHGGEDTRNFGFNNDTNTMDAIEMGVRKKLGIND